jgi:hypothetical protein
MVVCCYNIRKCADYIAAAGSGYCEGAIGDPCGIGPCRIIQPAGGERSCVDNLPPEVQLLVKGPGDTKGVESDKLTISSSASGPAEIGFTLNVKDDSDVKTIAVDYGDDATKTSEKIASTSSNGGAVKLSREYTHTYSKSGTYKAVFKVTDDADSTVEKSVELEMKLGN